MRSTIIRKFSGLLLLTLLTSIAVAGKSKTARNDKDTVFNPQSVLKIMKRVGDWQLQYWQTKGFTHKKTDWTNAALYTGLFD